jgi:hypothetical protein
MFISRLPTVYIPKNRNKLLANAAEAEVVVVDTGKVSLASGGLLFCVPRTALADSIDIVVIFQSL